MVMIRNVKEKHTSYKIFPLLFWKKCEKCDKEFIWESGFEYHDNGYPFPTYYNFCGRCFSNVEEVDSYIKKPYTIPPPPPPQVPKIDKDRQWVIKSNPTNPESKDNN